MSRFAGHGNSPLVQDFFFTTCAGIPMSLNSPIQECSTPPINSNIQRLAAKLFNKMKEEQAQKSKSDDDPKILNQK
jgi:hypothetical protein